MYVLVTQATKALDSYVCECNKGYDDDTHTCFDKDKCQGERTCSSTRYVSTNVNATKASTTATNILTFALMSMNAKETTIAVRTGLVIKHLVATNAAAIMALSMTANSVTTVLNVTTETCALRPIYWN